MSKIKKVLGHEETFVEDTLTEEQEKFLREEGFEWNEYTEWNFNAEKDGYNIWIDVNVGYFTLYIFQGTLQGDSELEETFYWDSQEEFEGMYDEILDEIDSFFRNK